MRTRPCGHGARVTAGAGVMAGARVTAGAGVMGTENGPRLPVSTRRTYNRTAMERVIEGFAIETDEHWIFSVKGLLHPPTE